MKILFYEAQNLQHDASGISNPNLFWWEMYENGICYPVDRITEEELHSEIRDWLDQEELPCESLDEISLDSFSPNQKHKRDWFLETWENI